jgi:hypothetical protein
MALFKESEDDYLKLIDDWQDPNPKPYVVEHEGYWIVRDDLFPPGSKARGADYLIGHDPETRNIEEWVYGSSPATGYAQISIPYVCSKYNKKAVIFMAQRSMDKLHPYQKRGIEYGGVYHWVPNGMLNVTEKRAKDYVAESPETRRLLPIGVKHPTVTACLIRVARSLGIQPREVWSVGSSGTLNHALQLAFPDADVHCVAVGRTIPDDVISNATLHKSPYTFFQTIKPEEMPPYPSPPTYDAKLWRIMKEWHKEHERKHPVLVWNVGG